MVPLDGNYYYTIDGRNKILKSRPTYFVILSAESHKNGMKNITYRRIVVFTYVGIL